MKVIYAITNECNGCKYVGSALDFRERTRLHVSQLNREKHHSIYLQRAWVKYGSESFIFSVLEELKDPEMLIPREEYWINELQPVYNMCKTAGSSLGIKRRPETLEKLSKALSGVKHPQWRSDLKAMSQGGENHWQYGKKMPEHVKQKKV
jgi:group I intron endonuclease